MKMNRTVTITALLLASCLLVTARRNTPRDVITRDVLKLRDVINRDVIGRDVQCEHEGEMFDPAIWAPECPVLKCVDYVTDPGQCCPHCPAGENCWLNGELIPGGSQMTVDGDCMCRCPSRQKYAEHGRQTQADCNSECPY